jgi:antitoxin VapB
MSLNIKDPEAHKLARLLAEETDQTITAAVVGALRESLEQARRRRKSQAALAELLAIGKRGAASFRGPYDDHGDTLYDEKGLPK